MFEFPTEQPINIVKAANQIDYNVSTEAFETIKSIPKFFTVRLNKMIDFFKSTSANLTAYTPKEINIYHKDLLKNRFKYKKAMSKLDYVSIKRRKVPTGIGINVDILELTRVMTESTTVVSDNLDGILKDTTETIARLVTDKGYRQSSRPPVIDRKYLAANKLLETNIDKVLDPKVVNDTLAVKDLMPSLPHLEEAIELAVDYGGEMTTRSLDSIKEDIAVIANYAESLYQVLREEQDVITKKRILEISEYLQTSAEFVTNAIKTLYISNKSIIIINNLVTVVTKD